MEEKMQFQSNLGARLAGVVHRPDTPSGSGVVICHGMLSTKDTPKHLGIANALVNQGYTVLRFDFSGRGESSGDLLELTFTRQVHECRCAMEQLLRMGVRRIGLVGSSMGGTVSILSAAQGQVDALVTMAAVGRTDLLPVRAVSERGLSVWKRKGSIRMQGERVGYSLVQDALQINVAQAAAQISCPWLILHGDKDEVIPLDDPRHLFEASSKKARLEIIHGADHRFSNLDHQQQVTQMIVDFFEECSFV